ncbi:MAG: hypothetical protein QOG49_759 [Frankiaceae bacterium]|nr:hypothetical protein [Frankiaceae bacterium]
MYRLTPDDFVTARDSLTRTLRAAGDKELSAQVKALRRPSVAAWLVNQLVRAHPADVDELLETGSALRDTQLAVLGGQADGSQLQALTATRRQQIDALVAAARRIAEDAGRAAAPLDAVDRTLVAATSDPAAADAVRSGRLVKELSYSGFGMGDDLADAVGPALLAVSRPSPRQPSAAAAKPAGPAAPRHGKAREPEPPPDPAAQRRAANVAAATAAVADAQRTVQEALGAADDAQRAFEVLSTAVDRLEADESRLAAELHDVRGQLATAREQQRGARGAARTAHADAERARSALVKAQQRLGHLR